MLIGQGYQQAVGQSIQHMSAIEELKHKRTQLEKDLEKVNRLIEINDTTPEIIEAYAILRSL